MNRENLQKMESFLSTTLPEYLKNAPKDSFDLYSWGEKTECGTVCCAIGWASKLGLFEGLKLVEGEDKYGNPIFLVEYISTKGEVFRGWAAVGEIFGFSSQSEVTRMLFSHHKYVGNSISPDEVSWRIGKLLDDGPYYLLSLGAVQLNIEYKDSLKS